MFGQLRLFEPAQGQTVLEPTGSGKGYWVGAPGALYDDEADRFYLYYRVREPRPVRGKECHVASSADGVCFQPVWTATQQDLGTTSMERSSLFRTPEGRWRLYLSYVGEDAQWRIDYIEADRPERFDVRARRPVFRAADVDAEGVKDPWVARIGPLYYMLVSYAPRPERLSTQEKGTLHATGDVYNTGLTKSSTGLAISEDGVRWQWLGEVFPPSETGWDSWCARLGSLVYVPPVYLGFYDGAAGVEENYEERCGLAVSTDLWHFRRVTVAGPALTSPHASGCVRYVDGLYARGAYWFYYEFARPDGSHELRVSRVVPK
ncbi:MAG: hypothetical protein HPY83_12765 [Anaerolineae bacterium]|nr:hypothetical protein [Anaerolineae bacterium]